MKSFSICEVSCMRENLSVLKNITLYNRIINKFLSELKLSIINESDRKQVELHFKRLKKLRK